MFVKRINIKSANLQQSIQFYFGIIFSVLLLFSCKDKNEVPEPPAETWNPTPYNLEIPAGFPSMEIPAR